jgi:pimeloyl-ACP methyl ester carboxylesterase
MEQPNTRYVAVGDADVAYQVVGEGPLDLLYCYGLGRHLEMFWEVPEAVEYLRRLAAFSRLIFFDRRGTGASDGIARNAIPTWEEWSEDLKAVLDAVESDRAAILASLDAGPIAIMFAAMHPERVTSLILLNTAARYAYVDDYPFGVPPDTVAAMVTLVRERWGTPDSFASRTRRWLEATNWSCGSRGSFGARPRRARPPPSWMWPSGATLAKHCRLSRRRPSCCSHETIRWCQLSWLGSWPTGFREPDSSSCPVGISALHRRRTHSSTKLPSSLAASAPWSRSSGS